MNQDKQNTTMKPQLYVPLFLLLAGISKPIVAQETLILHIPDTEIWADKLLSGDADIYGLGNWQCDFSATIIGHYLWIHGKITFSEQANDHTVIVGTVHRCFNIKTLSKQSGYEIIGMKTNKGNAHGMNIGARGYTTFLGGGIVKTATFVTDTFGNDVGKVGGKVKFMPLVLRIKHLYA